MKFVYVCLLSLVFAVGTIATDAMAETRAAVPVMSVEAVPIAAPARAFDPALVMELYSAESCVFCPKAEMILERIINKTDVIGFVCPVDYFKMNDNPYALPFCSQRQSTYNAVTKSGPNYTPQLVVNGQFNVLGHDLDAIRTAFGNAKPSAPETIMIENDAPAGYGLVFPALAQVYDGDDALGGVVLYLKRAVLRKSQPEVMPFIVVRSLGLPDWEGTRIGARLNVELKDDEDAAAILYYDRKTLHIKAAGIYKE